MDVKGNCSGTSTTTSNQPKKIKTTNHLEIADLPEEIIRDILVRLPVKFLLKFKCVSKSWFSLISSPPFVKDHLEFSSNNADSTNQKIMFDSYEQIFDLKQCPINSSMFETTTFGSDVDYPNKSPSRAVTIVGSCNGIICIANDLEDFILWNPSTRKYKLLPRFMVSRSRHSSYTWGFGYSQSKDDYKVVVVFDIHGMRLDIYSLRNDSWKSIKDYRFGMLTSEGLFASGKLHFTASIEGKVNIVSIDLNSEAYGILKKPNYGDGCTSTSLGLLGGCLSFLYNYQGIRMDVWVLKEYDVNESWTRVVSIPQSNYPHSLHFIYYPFMMIMPNGEFVLGFEKYVVVYNPMDNSFRFFQINNSFRSSCVYYESLVPV